MNSRLDWEGPRHLLALAVVAMGLSHFSKDPGHPEVGWLRSALCRESARPGQLWAVPVVGAGGIGQRVRVALGRWSASVGLVFSGDTLVVEAL